MRVWVVVGVGRCGWVGRSVGVRVGDEVGREYGGVAGVGHRG